MQTPIRPLRLDNNRRAGPAPSDGPAAAPHRETPETPWPAPARRANVAAPEQNRSTGPSKKAVPDPVFTSRNGLYLGSRRADHNCSFCSGADNRSFCDRVTPGFLRDDSAPLALTRPVPLATYRP